MSYDLSWKNIRRSLYICINLSAGISFCRPSYNWFGENHRFESVLWDVFMIYFFVLKNVLCYFNPLLNILSSQYEYLPDFYNRDKRGFNQSQSKGLIFGLPIIVIVPIRDLAMIALSFFGTWMLNLKSESYVLI